MKLHIARSLAALLLAASLTGCAPRKNTTQWVAELAQEGKAVKWPDGRVLKVNRRQGNTIEGIRLVRGGSGPTERAVEAERGAIAVDADGRTVTVTLYNAVLYLGTNRIGSLTEFSVIASH